MEHSEISIKNLIEQHIVTLIRTHSNFYLPELNYRSVHGNLLSILEVSRKLLMETNGKPDVEIQTHIYNLLGMAEKLIDKEEFELLHKIKGYLNPDISKESGKLILSGF